MKYLIQVSSSDIQEGIRDNCLHCPVAIALNRIVPKSGVLGGRGCMVGTNRVTFRGSRYPLPKIAINAITDFDNGRLVAPFSFEIEI